MLENVSASRRMFLILVGDAKPLLPPDPVVPVSGRNTP
jgi:hypothetical protein